MSLTKCQPVLSTYIAPATKMKMLSKISPMTIPKIIQVQSSPLLFLLVGSAVVSGKRKEKFIEYICS